VLTVAGSADSIFRTLQTLPGVAATDELGSRLALRGGGPDENLTIMDGVEIHSPYRRFGLTSAFNPETLRTFELSTGAFAAHYGDRLSSLLVVENRDGDDTERFSGTFSRASRSGPGTERAVPLLPRRDQRPRPQEGQRVRARPRIAAACAGAEPKRAVPAVVPYPLPVLSACAAENSTSATPGRCLRTAAIRGIETAPGAEVGEHLAGRGRASIAGLAK
jgi:TonB-dependent receptor-like protein